MKKPVINFLLLLFVGGAVYGTLLQARTSHISESLTHAIAAAREFYAAHPALAIGGFCLAHLLSSAFSIPGSCTLLNTLAGAVFGFWLGCAIVYPVTVLSATCVYALGMKLRGTSLAKSYDESLEHWRRILRRHDFLFLVGLRLSPLLPFGLLNLVMGVLGVPFSLYLLTTTVGIFFDVTLLNNLGAGLGSASPQSENSLAISFFILLAAFFLLRIALAKAYDQKGREQTA